MIVEFSNICFKINLDVNFEIQFRSKQLSNTFLHTKIGSILKVLSLFFDLVLLDRLF